MDDAAYAFSSALDSGKSADNEMAKLLEEAQKCKKAYIEAKAMAGEVVWQSIKGAIKFVRYKGTQDLKIIGASSAATWSVKTGLQNVFKAYWSKDQSAWWCSYLNFEVIRSRHPKELETLSTLADKAHEESLVLKQSPGVWGPSKKRARDSVEGVAAEGGAQPSSGDSDVEEFPTPKE
jgi:hypothetical protein